MNKEQKDKLLKWLCKKCQIIDLFFDETNELKFHFIINKTIVSNYALIENLQEPNAIKKKNDDDHIIDLLLDISRKGYTISNCVDVPKYYFKIMEPFCSYEQLQIEFDLNNNNR